MADVRLSIAGREYIVTCKDGEEARLSGLGSMVDQKAREAGGSAGGLNESRQLLFASLLLADQLYDLKDGAASAAPATGISAGFADQMAQTVERLADRLETLVQGLEKSD
jgi:cell division protein ZapA